MADTLKNVFQNHARLGYDESNQSSDVENVFRRIVSRVQYNEMLYMGACGGAMCAGRSLLSSWAPSEEFDLFNFCMGPSLLYDAGTHPTLCSPHQINHETYKITGGAGLAVHIENDIADASSFQACLGGKWWEWCQRSRAAHQNAVEKTIRCTGPWFHWSVGVWWLRINGDLIHNL